MQVTRHIVSGSLEDNDFLMVDLEGEEYHADPEIMRIFLNCEDDQQYALFIEIMPADLILSVQGSTVLSISNA